MGFEYVGMWPFHNTTTTQMEGGKNDSNPTHPILKWVTWDSWWYWIKCKHPKLNICLVERLDINRT
jgi:hypothetical protein